MKATDRVHPIYAGARRALIHMARLLAAMTLLVSLLGIIQTMVLAGHLDIEIHTTFHYVYIDVFSGEYFHLRMDFRERRERKRPQDIPLEYDLRPERRVRASFPTLVPSFKIYYKPISDPDHRSLRVDIPYVTFLIMSALALWRLRRIQVWRDLHGFPVGMPKATEDASNADITIDQRKNINLTPDK
jgi:hypothetical protein